MAELQAKLAWVCRHALARRPADARAPEVVTPAVVRRVLGEGAADRLPAAVRDAIARERRRLGEPSESGTEKSNDWIEWLQQLPWNRRTTAPVDLARVRVALDAGHAGLGHAKACILQYLAVRRGNPSSSGAVLWFRRAAGNGQDLTRPVHGRSPRARVRQARLRRPPRRDRPARPQPHLAGRSARLDPARAAKRRHQGPVFVLDEIDKLGSAPAAVLLEVLDPEQNDRFRDAFAELPFDLSEVLFITTANDTARIPHPLRDRLEIVDLPGYSEDEKVAIAETHLVGSQNRAAGLTGHAGPVHPGRLPAHHPRLHQRAGHPATRPLLAVGLPAGGARARDRRRVARPHGASRRRRCPPSSASRGPATRTGSTPSARSSTQPPCRKLCASGGGGSWRGWTGWRRPTPSMRAGATTSSAC